MATTIPFLFFNKAATPRPRLAAFWPSATNAYPDTAYSTDTDYEVAGKQVFRLEYYYLQKLPAGGTALVSFPPSWGTVEQISIEDVSAIVVAVAVIDRNTRTLLSNAQLAEL